MTIANKEKIEESPSRDGTQRLTICCIVDGNGKTVKAITIDSRFI